LPELRSKQPIVRLPGSPANARVAVALQLGGMHELLLVDDMVSCCTRRQAAAFPRDGSKRKSGLLRMVVRWTTNYRTRGGLASPWVGSYHRNDRGEQRRPEPKALLLGIGL
jgi:hypothetical protein